jgi:tRNA nucleotidyltransferase (CCA-adding enzyme)
VIGRQAEEQNVAVYVVGGFVRDLLLGTPSMDFDLVVEGDAIRLARALTALAGGRTSSHHRFGTAKWRLNRENPRLLELCGEQGSPQDLPSGLDFVTARTEFYAHPTALPSVERGSIKLDLHRRDFTINTLALRLDGRFFGQLLDHWGGRRDLEQGVIRVLHSLSFIDDPTRMLRAVRLEQRLGFTIDARTLELLLEALPLLARVSGERVRNELMLSFEEDRRAEILFRLHQLGLLVAIHPALTWDRWLSARFAEARAFTAPVSWRLSTPVEPEALLYGLWLHRLPEDQAEAVARRLNLPLDIQEPALEANRLGRELSAKLGADRPSAAVARLEGYQETTLVAAWLAMSGRRAARRLLENYLGVWRHVEPQADGNDLRAAGLQPGPDYRRILWALRAAWLDGEVSSRDEEQALLGKLLAASDALGSVP